MSDNRENEAWALINACGSSWGGVGSGPINAICYILMGERIGDGENPGSNPERRQTRDAGITAEPPPSPPGDPAPVKSHAVTEPTPEQDVEALDIIDRLAAMIANHSTDDIASSAARDIGYAVATLRTRSTP